MPTGARPSAVNPSSWQGPVLLDTCAWTWLVDGHARMGKAVCRTAVEAAARDARLFLAPISMWEVATKAAKKKLALSLPAAEWIQRGKRRSCLLDAPFTADVAVESAALPGDFHGDPADRLIVASARILGAVLVTGDSAIIAYAKAGFVRVWSL